jgi:hypothetical protein
MNDAGVEATVWQTFSPRPSAVHGEPPETTGVWTIRLRRDRPSDPWLIVSRTEPVAR